MRRERERKKERARERERERERERLPCVSDVVIGKHGSKSNSR